MESIVFGYPQTYYNKENQSFSFLGSLIGAIVLLLIIFSALWLFPILHGGSRFMYLAVVLFGAVIVISGVLKVVNAKQIFIDSNSIKTKYRFFPKKNSEVSWSKCTGYFPAKYNFRGGGAGPKLETCEIGLFFPNQKISLKTVYFKQGAELDILLGMLRSKGLKNLNEKDHSPNGKFIDLDYIPPKDSKSSAW